MADSKSDEGRGSALMRRSVAAVQLVATAAFELHLNVTEWTGRRAGQRGKLYSSPWCQEGRQPDSYSKWPQCGAAAHVAAKGTL